MTPLITYPHHRLDPTGWRELAEKNKPPQITEYCDLGCKHTVRVFEARHAAGSLWR